MKLKDVLNTCILLSQVIAEDPKSATLRETIENSVVGNMDVFVGTEENRVCHAFSTGNKIVLIPSVRLVVNG